MSHHRFKKIILHYRHRKSSDQKPVYMLSITGRRFNQLNTGSWTVMTSTIAALIRRWCFKVEFSERREGHSLSRPSKSALRPLEDINRPRSWDSWPGKVMHQPVHETWNTQQLTYKLEPAIREIQARRPNFLAPSLLETCSKHNFTLKTKTPKIEPEWMIIKTS